MKRTPGRVEPTDAMTVGGAQYNAFGRRPSVLSSPTAVSVGGAQPGTLGLLKWTGTMFPNKDLVRKEAIPLKRIGEPEIRERLRDADLIYGCDTASDSISLFYGKEFCEELEKSSEAREIRVVSFELDFRTSEPAFLCAEVKSLRGKHDYVGYLRW